MKKTLLLIFVISYYGCITINPVVKNPTTNSKNDAGIPRLDYKTKYPGICYDGTPTTAVFNDAEFNQPASDFDPSTMAKSGATIKTIKNETLAEKLTRDGAAAGTPPSRKQIYKEVAANNKIPFVYSYDEIGKPTTDSNGCETIKLNFNCTSTSFMNADYETQGQRIYPSAIYHVQDFQNGKFVEITKNRKPVILSTDNPNLKTSSFIIVDNPSIITLREGVKNLFSTFDDTRNGNMDFRYQTLVSSNSLEHQLKLSTGGGGSFGPFSANLEATYNRKDKTSGTYITVDVIKDLFTINSFPDSSYFKEAGTNDNSLVVISSVTYGLRLLANIDITGHEEEVQQTLKTKASVKFAFSANGHLDLDYLEKTVGETAKVNCYVVGGPANATCSFTLKDFQENITKIVGGTTYNNARPIQYTLSDINGNLLAIQSSVTDIAQTTCPLEVVRLVGMQVTWTTTGDGKDWNSQPVVEVFDKSGNHIGHIDCCSADRNNDKWDNGNVQTRDLKLLSTNVSPADLTSGRIEFKFNPNGRDNWDYRAEVKFIFSGSGQPFSKGNVGRNTFSTSW